MKTITTLITLAFVIVTAMPGAVAANPEQTGNNGTCVDYNVTYEHPGINSPLTVVEVDPGTIYQVSQSGGAAVFVDFYRADGSWITYNSGAASGVVPGSAAFGTMCVGLLDFFPDVPAPGATWSYQDGF